jgi:hypothetical protein
MCLPFRNLFVWCDALQYTSSNLRGWCVAYVGDAKCGHTLDYAGLAASLYYSVTYIDFWNMTKGSLLQFKRIRFPQLSEPSPNPHTLRTNYNGNQFTTVPSKQTFSSTFPSKILLLVPITPARYYMSWQCHNPNLIFLVKNISN